MKKLLLIPLLGMGLLFFSACAAKSPTPAPELEPTVTSAAQVVYPTQPIALEPAEDNCVICHTDKEMLIDTAAPEAESHESESEGVG